MPFQRVLPACILVITVAYLCFSPATSVRTESLPDLTTLSISLNPKWPKIGDEVTVTLSKNVSKFTRLRSRDEFYGTLVSKLKGKSL